MTNTKIQTDRQTDRQIARQHCERATCIKQARTPINPSVKLVVTVNTQSRDRIVEVKGHSTEHRL